MPAVDPSILFSGCAAEHDRTPARAATLAIARALRMDLVEARPTLCCGARACQDTGKPDARHLLQPLLTSALAGHPIVCLSAACRNALTVHFVDMMRARHATPSELLRHPLQVLDYVEFLSRSERALERLRERATQYRAARVALHGVCHGTHNPARWPSGRTLTVALEQGGILTFTLKDTDVPDSGLATLLTAAGATIVEDVSVSCDCAQLAPAAGNGGHGDQAQQPFACLAASALAGAEFMVTPCALCYGDLKRYQRTLAQNDAARNVEVLHLAQYLGLACGLVSARRGLRSTATAKPRVAGPRVA